MGRVFNVLHGTIGGGYPVHHIGGGDNNGLPKLPLQPLLNDFHVQQPQKSHPKTKAQRGGGFRFVMQGGVVESQALQGTAQILKVLAVHGVNSGIHHGLDLPVPR